MSETVSGIPILKGFHLFCPACGKPRTIPKEIFRIVHFELLTLAICPDCKNKWFEDYERPKISQSEVTQGFIYIHSFLQNFCDEHGIPYKIYQYFKGKVKTIN